MVSYCESPRAVDDDGSRAPPSTNSSWYSGLILTGCVMSTVTFQLPVRYQLVNQLTSIEAGVRVLPFGGAFPVGMIVGSTLGTKAKVPGIYLVMMGSILQIIGCALLGTQSAPDGISATVYGSQVIAGIGCGMTYQIFYLLIPFTVADSDKGKQKKDRKSVGTSSAMTDRFAILPMIPSRRNGCRKPVPNDWKCVRALHHHVRLQHLYTLSPLGTGHPGSKHGTGQWYSGLDPCGSARDGETDPLRRLQSPDAGPLRFCSCAVTCWVVALASETSSYCLNFTWELSLPYLLILTFLECHLCSSMLSSFRVFFFFSRSCEPTTTITTTTILAHGLTT